ncbi:MAG: DUF2974 domain-containing protein [Lachnospiraceae bacterium]|nr:DUF2974 domain-containing protein [Lachnospiraceae bacterium]
MTDNDLILLEQLTYIDKELFDASGVKMRNIKGEITVHEYLEPFNRHLEKLEKDNKMISGGMASGKEYAQVIKALYNNKEIGNLKMKIRMGKGNRIDAITFVDEKDKNSAYVAFRGTKDAADWLDNCQGLGQADTDLQVDALNYVNSLPYKNITTIGHSKGGNKAQYTAILSDKVKKCVSLDGQGFSKEFFEKYGRRIKVNASKITSYSIDGDFVNILLSRIPGAEYKYCKGNKMTQYIENHSPVSFFKYTMDGELWSIDDFDGNVVVEDKNQAWAMEALHEFTCYVINTMPAEDRKKMGNYLGILLAAALTEDGIDFKGKHYGKSDMFNFIFKENDECTAKFLAYLIKYCQSRPDGLTIFKKLIILIVGDQFVPDDWEEVLEKVYNLYKTATFFKRSGHKIVKRVTKGKSDIVVNKVKKKAFHIVLKSQYAKIILKKFKKVLPENVGLKVLEEYEKIPNVDVYNERQDLSVASYEEVWDFSNKTYQTLMEKLDLFDKKSDDFAIGWNRYYEEKWYVDLDIEGAKKYLNKKANSFAEVNSECKKSMIRIFEKEWRIDSKKAESIAELTKRINKIKNDIRTLADAIE